MLQLLVSAISKVFTTIKDFQALLSTTAIEIDNLRKKQKEVEDDMFIQKCSLNRVIEFESICNLKNGRAELTLPQRRKDILITFASNVPYTLPKLKSFLNTVIGRNAWELIVDYNNYAITIKILRITEEGVDPLLRGLREMLPCHISYTVTRDIDKKNDLTYYIGGGVCMITNSYLECEVN